MEQPSPAERIQTPFPIPGPLGLQPSPQPALPRQVALHQVLGDSRVGRNDLGSKLIKWHVDPVTTQISLGIQPGWSESSLVAQWRAIGRWIYGFHVGTCFFAGFCPRSGIIREKKNLVSSLIAYLKSKTRLDTTKSGTGCGSSIGSEFAWHASGPEFDPHVRHILSWRLGHEKNYMAILPLPLIQEEQLSVSGERMCTKYW